MSGQAALAHKLRRASHLRYAGAMPMRSQSEVRLASAALWFSILAAGLAYLVYVSGQDRWGFAALGWVCGALVLLPFAIGRASPVSAWGTAAFAILVGTTLRGQYLAVTANADAYSYLILGRGFTSLTGAAFTTAAITCAMTLGYLAFSRKVALGPSKSKRKPIWAFSTEALNSTTGKIVIYGLAAIGFVAAVLYVRAVGGLSVNSIRARRTTISSLDLAGQSTYRSYGEYQFLARLSALAFLLELARLYFAPTRRVQGRLGLAVLGLNALFLPWYTTTRDDLLALGFGFIAITYASGRKFNIREIVIPAVIVLALGASFSQNRLELQDRRLANAQSTTSGITNLIFVNRNMADVGKALLITDSTGSKLELMNGSTISAYATALVPRSVWRSKPLVAPGPIVGSVIYGSRVSGVPPGYAGELVWNFGRPLGVFFGLLAGAAVGLVDRLRRQGNAITGAVFSATIALPFGSTMVGISIGKALFDLLLGIVTLFMIAIVLNTGAPALNRRDKPSAVRPPPV